MHSPSGFENIVIILRNIGIHAGIRKYVPDGKREWLLLENDGAIYTIIIKLISNVYSCGKCGKSIYGKDNAEEHDCVVLSEAGMTLEFDWVILLPGLLYLEMNAAKAWIDLNWEVFMQEMVSEFGIHFDFIKNN